jgi:hypothetical protein
LDARSSLFRPIAGALIWINERSGQSFCNFMGVCAAFEASAAGAILTEAALGIPLVLLPCDQPLAARALTEGG